VYLGLTGVVARAVPPARALHAAPPPVFDARSRALIAPLDEFSFPSGHTLHAVAFSLVAIAHYPPLAWVLVPFTAAVAASRVVLGLHYPSDVLAATSFGAAVAAASMWTWPVPA
jgi:undecaprenyl-diphosphatase